MVGWDKGCDSKELLGNAVGEKQAAGLDSGAEERSADAAIESVDTVRMERLAETIEGSGVAEGEVVGLGLQADFDGIEGVFDDFTDAACDLQRC